ncbi:transposase [Paenibacillaceae bacterium]|nr:transposase [Paenibacillaceae bacterium]
MKLSQEQREQLSKELTILLLYLNSWEEKELGYKYRRSWKGYDFDVLNELADDDYIIDSKRSKSVGFTDSGEKFAEELMIKFLAK